MYIYRYRCSRDAIGITFLYSLRTPGKPSVSLAAGRVE